MKPPLTCRDIILIIIKLVKKKGEFLVKFMQKKTLFNQSVFFKTYFVPKSLSPASPRPGRM